MRTLAGLLGFGSRVHEAAALRRRPLKRSISFESLEDRVLLSDGPSPYPQYDDVPADVQAAAAAQADQAYNECVIANQNNQLGFDCNAVSQQVHYNYIYNNWFQVMLAQSLSTDPGTSTQTDTTGSQSTSTTTGFIDTLSDWWDSSVNTASDAWDWVVDSYYDAYWGLADWLGDEESTFGQLAANDIYGNDVWGDPGVGGGATYGIPFVLGGGGTIIVGAGCEAIYIPDAGVIAIYCYYQGGGGYGGPGWTFYVGPQMTYDLETPEEYTGAFVNVSGGAVAPTGLPGLSVDGTPSWWNQQLNGGGTNGDPYTLSGTANFGTGTGGSVSCIYQQYFLVGCIPVGQPQPNWNPFWWL